MSDQTRREDLDAYLLGESTLSKAYAALDRPKPPAGLDEAVMGQASRALHRAKRRRWMVPAGVAAMVLLSFSVVTRMLLEPFEPEAGITTSNGQAEGLLLERPNQSSARPAAPSFAGQGVTVTPAEPAPATAPLAAPESDSPAPSSPEGPRMNLQRSPEQLRETAKKLDDIKARIPQKISGQQHEVRDPAVWLEEITTLANDGEVSEAQAEFERFRDVYPDHSVDAELLQLSQ